MTIPSKIRVSAILAVLVLFSGVFLPYAQDAAKPTVPFVVSGDWRASAFGDVGGTDKISAENFEIAEQGNGKVVLRSSNDRGKIASTSEGIAFYYQEIPEKADFELSALVTVKTFGKNNQVSFGIMFRDTIYQNEFVKDKLGSYLAVGPINAANPVAQFVFHRTAEGLVRKGDIAKSQAPGPGAVYVVSMKKNGDNFTLRFGDEEQQVLAGFAPFAGTSRYLGFFTSRNAAVSLSDIKLAMGSKSVSALKIDYSGMKTRYRIGEQLDPANLKVSAVYEGGSAEALKPGDYDLLGYSSLEPGDFELNVSSRGISVSVPYTVVPLVCTSLSVLSYPLKTSYYPGDDFESTGLRVIATYDEGYRVAEILSDLYRLDIGSQSASGFRFEASGKVTATISSRETPDTKLSFDLDVKNARIENLSVGRMPERTVYFVGEGVDVRGMTVFANYSDGSRVRLTPGKFSVSALDSASPGEKSIAIEHKGKQTSLKVSVRRKALKGLEVSSRIRTTYGVGESFDSKDLAVSLVYDNGDREKLGSEKYRVDSSIADFSKPGMTWVRVQMKDGSVPPLDIPIAVREPAKTAWSTIRFGQSTSDAKNYIEPIGEGAYRIVALEGGGKVATDHDGIAFLYTILDAKEDNFELSADISVLLYAKDPHDGQESFGIMARDALGPAGSSGISASNIVGVGGFSGGTRNANGTQAFVRSGVAAQDGTGSTGLRRTMMEPVKPELSTTSPAKAYRLSLSKTNSGFVAKLNEGPETMLWEPDLMEVQDGKLYLGFFTARLATIEVRNIRLSVTASAADAARVYPPPESIVPILSILSPGTSGEGAYTLALRSNVAGSLTVKRGLEILVEDKEIAPEEEVFIPTALQKDASTAFTAALLPDDRQVLSSYKTLMQTLPVSMRSYIPGGDIVVAPDGKPEGKGTAESPLDLDTAISYLRAGQSILLGGGTYARSGRVFIPRFNSGRPVAYKRIAAATGAKPVLDFSKKSDGVILAGDFWRIEGIDVTNSGPNMRAFTVSGSDNVVEACRIYGNADSGLQISRTDGAATDISRWPSRNLILNCEAFDNRDPSENNADGFAAKLTSGVGNVFRGCISHHNIDDGWDLYTKAGTGAIGAVLLENCVAYANGKTSAGIPGKGDKNGFKLGGEGIAVPHVVRNCLSFDNGASGFTSNSNPSVVFEGAFGWNNTGVNFSFSTYPGTVGKFSARSVFSYKTKDGAGDNPPSGLAGSYFDGKVSKDSSGNLLTEAAFKEALVKAGFSLDLLNK